MTSHTVVTQEKLLHIKFLDDVAAERFVVQAEDENPLTRHTQNDGGVTGGSIRIIARTLADGRVRIAMNASHRVHAVRASGKPFRYWTSVYSMSLATTKQGLVVRRSFDRKKYRARTEHLFTSPRNERRDFLAATPALFDSHSLRDAMAPILPRRWDSETAQTRVVRVLEGPETGEMTAVSVRQMIDDTLAGITGSIEQALGEFPDVASRFPIRSPNTGVVSTLNVSGLIHFLDAQDYRQVTANAFGKTRVTKPLVRQTQALCENCGTEMLSWYRLFRGLVPTEWIAQAMAAVVEADPRTPIGRGWGRLSLNAEELTGIRRILLRVPQTVLKRILAEQPGQAIRPLRDAVREIGSNVYTRLDLDVLPALITARGQKNIRSARDLEGIIRALPVVDEFAPALRRSEAAKNVMLEEQRLSRELGIYNHAAARLEGVPRYSWEEWRDEALRERALGTIQARNRELMTIEQRERVEREEQRRLERLEKEKERAAWARESTQRIEDIALDGYSITVAREATELTLWGQTLNNCIGGYSRNIGLDLLVAIRDRSGKLRLNLEITQDEGIVQMLGTNNRDAEKEIGIADALMILDALVAEGFVPDQHALGVPRREQAAAA